MCTNNLFHILEGSAFHRQGVSSRSFWSLARYNLNKDWYGKDPLIFSRSAKFNADQIFCQDSGASLSLWSLLIINAHKINTITNYLYWF